MYWNHVISIVDITFIKGAWSCQKLPNPGLLGHDILKIIIAPDRSQTLNMCGEQTGGEGQRLLDIFSRGRVNGIVYLSGLYSGQYVVNTDSSRVQRRVDQCVQVRDIAHSIEMFWLMEEL